MITNRPKYLSENIRFYDSFPRGYNMDVDYSCLPELLNFDFHTLNGILPLTKSRFDYIGQNGESDGEKTTVVFVNPLPEEYEYFESIGVTEFQAISIVLNFYAFEETESNVLKGKPYSVSLVPMEKRKQIDTWNIELLKKFDLEELCQRGGFVMSKFNPFAGFYDGIGSHYSLFSQITQNDHSDSIGFQWGLYFLCPKYDIKEVQIPENHTYSRQINAKYRKHKTKLYFEPFKDVNPRRLWGCDSPIELFLIQGLYIRGLIPEIQMGIYNNGDIFPNYYKMAEQETFIGQERLITSADLYFKNQKLAIFCDGKEFHDTDKDKKISQSLIDLGIKPLRFSGKEITEEIEIVLDTIENELNK
jgi:hypothetical protein